VREVAEVIKMADGKDITASQLLNQFLFPPKMQHNFVGKLSGGEKRRLQLLRVLMANPNFLILDEPTNELDITTLNVLEDYLERFDGCLLIVSHDRYFMDRLVDHLFVFKGDGTISDFPGNYSDFRDGGGSFASPALPSKQEKENKPAVKTETKKLSFNEKRELETLEKSMPKTEQEITQMELNLTKETDYQKLIDMSSAIEKAKDKLAEMELRWLELSEG
jgi:ATP-binding cassette subfamily F protein uup